MSVGAVKKAAHWQAECGKISLSIFSILQSGTKACSLNQYNRTQCVLLNWFYWRSLFDYVRHRCLAVYLNYGRPNLLFHSPQKTKFGVWVNCNNTKKRDKTIKSGAHIIGAWMYDDVSDEPAKMVKKWNQINKLPDCGEFGTIHSACTELNDSIRIEWWPVRWCVSSNTSSIFYLLIWFIRCHGIRAYLLDGPS